MRLGGCEDAFSRRRGDRAGVIVGWNRHPELPLFGVDPQTRAQLLQDFTRPLVIHNSRNIETRHNIFRSEPGVDDGAMQRR